MDVFMHVDVVVAFTLVSLLVSLVMSLTSMVKVGIKRRGDHDC